MRIWHTISCFTLSINSSISFSVISPELEKIPVGRDSQGDAHNGLRFSGPLGAADHVVAILHGGHTGDAQLHREGTLSRDFNIARKAVSKRIG